MSEDIAPRVAKVLADIPRDLPMPRYRFQRDDRRSDGVQSDSDKRAEQLMRGAQMPMCSALAR